jgi:hypothetical protein
MCTILWNNEKRIMVTFFQSPTKRMGEGEGRRKKGEGRRNEKREKEGKPKRWGTWLGMGL